MREREALVACETGDAKRGVGLLAVLYAETLDSTYVFNQARCYQKSNLPADADGKFREYLRLTKEPDGELAQRARAFMAEYQAETQRETTRITRRDSDTRGDGSAGREAGAALRNGAIVAGALGIVGIGAGAYFTLKMREKERTINGKIKENPSIDEALLKDERAAGQRFETLQYVGYGIGAASLTAGGVFFLLSLRKGDAVTTDGRNRQLALTPWWERDGAGLILSRVF